MKFKHTATQWKSGVIDRFGGHAFQTNTVKCRWESKNELFKDKFGRDTVSRHVVYLNDDVKVGDYMMKGTSSVSDPLQQSGAEMVMAVSKTTNLSNTKRLIKAWI